MKAPRQCKGCGNPLPVTRPMWCSDGCYEKQRRSHKRQTVRLPIPPQAFTRGYMRALAVGVDPLEALAHETDRLLMQEDALLPPVRGVKSPAQTKNWPRATVIAGAVATGGMS